MKKNIENSDMPISSPTMLAPRRVRSRKIENGISGSCWRIQIRHTITHPEHSQLRNGTGATVTRVDPRSGELSIQLTNGHELVLDQEQIEQADLRLAYVQHPFPAQGHTTDTAHVIIAGQTTREGTYVALTRARQATHLYAAPAELSPGGDQLERLAERVTQTEPEVPSISTPLAHEAAVRAEAEVETTAAQIAATAREATERGAAAVRPRHVARGPQPPGEDMRTAAPGPQDSDTQAPGKELPEPALERDDRQITSPQKRSGHEPEHAPQRVWPARETPEPDTPKWDADQPEREQTIGWEL